MELIPSAGLSLSSLIRGCLGMSVLIFIAYLFSNNRKAIAWKTVGIGLLIQVVIAIGVLKIKTDIPREPRRKEVSESPALGINSIV